MNFNGKTALLIGPGPSTGQVDLNNIKTKVNTIVTINDVILKHDSDIHLVGEKYFFDFLIQKHKNKVRDNINFFLGLNKDEHEYKITKSYYNKMRKQVNNLHYCEEISRINNGKYPFVLDSGLENKDKSVLKTLYNKFPMQCFSYVRTKILGNALQILLNLNFDTVYIIGFMDSNSFARDVELKANQSAYMPVTNQNFKPAAVMEFQKQVLLTINHFFKGRNKKLFTLCPQSNNYSGLDNYEF